MPNPGRRSSRPNALSATPSTKAPATNKVPPNKNNTSFIPYATSFFLNMLVYLCAIWWYSLYLHLWFFCYKSQLLIVLYTLSGFIHHDFICRWRFIFDNIDSGDRFEFSSTFSVQSVIICNLKILSSMWIEKSTRILIFLFLGQFVHVLFNPTAFILKMLLIMW